MGQLQASISFLIDLKRPRSKYNRANAPPEPEPKPEPEPIPSIPEPPEPEPIPIQISEVQVRGIGENSATIRVQTNKPVQARLIVDTTDKFEGVKPLEEHTEAEQTHAFQIDGLEPETIYFYQIQLLDEEGEQQVTDILSFETKPEPPPEIPPDPPRTTPTFQATGRINTDFVLLRDDPTNPILNDDGIHLELLQADWEVVERVTYRVKDASGSVLDEVTYEIEDGIPPEGVMEFRWDGTYKLTQNGLTLNATVKPDSRYYVQGEILYADGSRDIIPSTTDGYFDTGIAMQPFSNEVADGYKLNHEIEITTDVPNDYRSGRLGLSEESQAFITRLYKTVARLQEKQDREFNFELAVYFYASDNPESAQRKSSYIADVLAEYGIDREKIWDAISPVPSELATNKPPHGHDRIMIYLYTTKK
jgi:hypothetical protein